MTTERIIPTPAPSDLPSVTVTSEGNEISGEFHLMSITVQKSVNKVPYAQLVYLDGDAAKSDFELSNSDDFIPGNKIEILAGYHSEEETIFKGIITGQGIKSRGEDPSLIIIDCKDESVKMVVGRKNAYYYDSSDSDIMEEIISSYGLSADVESTNLKHKEMVKYYTTDWDFIVSRADVNGLLVIADDGEVGIKKPDTGQDAALSLIYGDTMLDFEAEIDARSQLSKIACSSWDYANQEMIEEENSDPSFKTNGNLETSKLADVIGLKSFESRHSGQVIDQELKSWADAKILKSALSRVIGRAKCQGFAKIKPGNILELDGVGDRFNGNAFVTSVRHQISVKNWETDIQFGLSEEWFARNEDIIEKPASGLLPGIHGLQVGIATQLQDDPDGEDRVLVRMPVINPDDEGVWARVATLDAGKNRGSFFRPEIDDEVVLGFMNGDPRDPVILGMFNSSAKPAPLTAKDENHEKGFFTRSEMKVHFDDDKIVMKLETPNGNIITLTDDKGAIVLEDENSNIIEMTADGIKMESPKDINIKATGDVNIEGTNVNAKANAQFKGEGSAGAEISTSAIAVVKGSLVQIN